MRILRYNIAVILLLHTTSGGTSEFYPCFLDGDKVKEYSDTEKVAIIPSVHVPIVKYMPITEELPLSPTLEPTEAIISPSSTEAPSLSWEQPGFWFHCTLLISNITNAEARTQEIQTSIVNSLAVSLQLHPGQISIDQPALIVTELIGVITSRTSQLRKFNRGHADTEGTQDVTIRFLAWISLAQYAIDNNQSDLVLTTFRMHLDEDSELQALSDMVIHELNVHNVTLRSTMKVRHADISSLDAEETLPPTVSPTTTISDHTISQSVYFEMGNIRVDSIMELVIVSLILLAAIMILMAGLCLFLYPKQVLLLYQKLAVKPKNDRDIAPSVTMQHTDFSSCLCCSMYANIYPHKISEPFEMNNPEFKSRQFSGTTNDSNVTEESNNISSSSVSKSYYSYYTGSWSNREKKKVNVDPNVATVDTESSKEDELYEHYSIRSPSSQYVIELNAIQ